MVNSISRLQYNLSYTESYFLCIKTKRLNEIEEVVLIKLIFVILRQVAPLPFVFRLFIFVLKVIGGVFFLGGGGVFLLHCTYCFQYN